MHKVKLLSYQLPLVNEIGYLKDIRGEFRHPNRQLDDLHVFIFVESGEIEVIEQERTYTLRAGDYLFLHKGIEHYGNKNYQPNTCWYYIHFFAPIPEEKTEYNWLPSPSIITEDTYLRTITMPKTGRIEQIHYLTVKLKQIIELQHDGPLAQSLNCYQLFLELYHQAKENHHKPQYEKIVRAVMGICQNNETKLTSEEISKHLHLNYSYISTVFKKVTGKTINQYQNELMVERAITLFNQTDANITEVSERLHFSNPFYFSRVFKQVTGISPSLYLKQGYRH
ncbi:AraC family transcriptional regulator [Amphibacillus sp. MSJ-3]|uniref:helix-turn-helix domain-containing protein n=1 Tax=Amphibacillus sp. MSJ-3 TaxID=2841505 RepID=UPI001C0EE9A9|nr:AraC family transcriptional regulator [Amphibacillus sp. MSJ-3]MBU5595360.1 AraC family transcriptional regulator [Amphibacillus sp. MSJ-3]